MGLIDEKIEIELRVKLDEILKNFSPNGNPEKRIECVNNTIELLKSKSTWFEYTKQEKILGKRLEIVGDCIVRKLIFSREEIEEQDIEKEFLSLPEQSINPILKIGQDEKVFDELIINLENNGYNCKYNKILMGKLRKYLFSYDFETLKETWNINPITIYQDNYNYRNSDKYFRVVREAITNPKQLLDIILDICERIVNKEKEERESKEQHKMYIEDIFNHEIRNKDKYTYVKSVDTREFAQNYLGELGDKIIKYIYKDKYNYEIIFFSRLWRHEDKFEFEFE